MSEKRLGFVGIILENRAAHSNEVNTILSQHAALIKARLGVPDADAGAAVIGLIVEGDDRALGQLTARLGNVPGVQVKSALSKAKSGEPAP